VAVIFSGVPETVSTQTLASLSLPEYSGLAGVAGRVGHVRPDMLTSASAPDRAACAAEAASDYYRWRTADYEATFRGCCKWDGTGLEAGVRWEVRYDGPEPAVLTRLLRPVREDDGDGYPVTGSGGTASDWLTGKVVSGTNSSGYVVRRIMQTATNIWADYSPTTEVTAGRLPSILSAPLPDLPVGQAVLYRESPDTPGTYECTPWGGQFRVTQDRTVREVTGGTLTAVSTGCDSAGRPTFTGTITLTFADRILSLDLSGRDLTGTLTYT
jgi:hypothetical protein